MLNFKLSIMKNILKLSLIASLFLIFNCSDEYLDLQPETDWNVENFYENETEVKIALSLACTPC